MAGAGFKTFGVGDVLTASDVNTYLMQQAVMVFADSSSRDTALGTAVGGGNALSTGMLSYRADGTAVEFYDGSVWSSVGQTPTILQVVQTVKDDTFTTSSSSFTDVTGLSVSITPSSASNKVLFIASIAVNQNASLGNTQLIALRDSTNLVPAASPGSREPVISQYNHNGLSNNTSQIHDKSFHILDSPATTSSVTYKIQVRQYSSQPTYINRSSADTDNANYSRAVSVLTVMEVAA